MNLGELQAALNKALAEGASKTDQVYLNVECLIRMDRARGEIVASEIAQEVVQHITDRKRRSVVIKGW